MQALCCQIVAQLPELAHIDMQRVLVCCCRSRKSGTFGVYATLTPLRFAGGQTIQRRRGRLWTIQKVVDESGREMLYLLSFYLPRFQDLPLEEKLTTIVHELWHIGPRCDGDLRRHPGRCYAHSRSKAAFDAWAKALAERWLATQPPPALFDFLRYSFQELAMRHATILARVVRRPRYVPLESDAERAREHPAAGRPAT
jgi:predicted metallopeptidase